MATDAEIDALMRALDDDDARVRWNAARTLAELGIHADAQVEAIQRLSAPSPGRLDELTRSLAALLPREPSAALLVANRQWAHLLAILRMLDAAGHRADLSNGCLAALAAAWAADRNIRNPLTDELLAIAERLGDRAAPLLPALSTRAGTPGGVTRRRILDAMARRPSPQLIDGRLLGTLLRNPMHHVRWGGGPELSAAIRGAALCLWGGGHTMVPLGRVAQAFDRVMRELQHRLLAGGPALVADEQLHLAATRLIPLLRAAGPDDDAARRRILARAKETRSTLRHRPAGDPRPGLSALEASLAALLAG